MAPPALGVAERALLIVSSIEPGATALALLALPAFFAWIIFGAVLDPSALAPGRLAGIALMTIALWSWTSISDQSRTPAVALVLFIYNCTVAIYLAYLGTVPHLSWFLLWPAVILHTTLAAFFYHAYRPRRQPDHHSHLSIFFTESEVTQ
jgi:hypothetical protein